MTLPLMVTFSQLTAWWPAKATTQLTDRDLRVTFNWWLSQEGQSVYGKAAKVSSVRNYMRSFLPEGVGILPKRPFIVTNEVLEEAMDLFKTGWLTKLVGRQ